MASKKERAQDINNHIPSVKFIVLFFKQIDAIVLYSSNTSSWIRQIDLEDAIIHNHLQSTWSAYWKRKTFWMEKGNLLMQWHACNSINHKIALPFAEQKNEYRSLFLSPPSLPRKGSWTWWLLFQNSFFHLLMPTPKGHHHQNLLTLD